MGITLIARRDALIDGLNMMISPQYTLKRRYGHSKMSTVAFGVGEWPSGFASFQEITGAIVPIVDTQTNVYTFSPISKTSIYTKLSGAGQSSFVSDLTWLYWVDGVSAKKYDGTSVWKSGIDTPTAAPILAVTETGVSAATWQPNTFFSTMGIIVDLNGNSQQLIAVNGGTAVGAVGKIGISSNGAPPWNQNQTQNTPVDGTVTWKNIGPIIDWAPATAFKTETNAYTQAGSCCMYDYVTGCFFVNIASNNGSTGNARPSLNPTPGVASLDNGTANSPRWMSIGTAASMPNGFGFGQWKPSTVIGAPPGPTRIIEPWLPPVAGQKLGTTQMYLQENTTGGTTASAYAAVNWGTTLGVPATDGQLTWVCCGSATWTTNTPYTAWSAHGGAFNVVKDQNGSLWACFTGGTSNNSGDPFTTWYWPSNTVEALNNRIIDTNSNVQMVTAITGDNKTTNGAHPPWNATKGGPTTDNHVTWTNQGSAYGTKITETTNVVWMNIGKSNAWAAASNYYLPNIGFIIPAGVAQFGSADIVDSGNIQFINQSGFTGGSKPTFSTTVGGETIDNGAVWYNNGPAGSSGFPWSTGHNYAISFKARSATDFYSVINPATGALPSAPGYGQLPPPSGSKSGHISTASAVATLTGANAGASVGVTFQGSLDPQVDTVVIWRDKDGGGSSNMFELTEVPNPPIINGTTPGTFTFIDTNLDSVLNTQILAPIAHQNDPPPAGLTLLVWHAGRLWGAVGNILYFSGGPDTAPGVGQEAWPPGNNFTLPGNITSLTSTTQGLIISVNDDAFVSTGTTASTFTVPILWQANFGVPTRNAIAQDGDNVFFFTTKGQIWHLSANGLAEIGYLNATDFAAMNPFAVYIAIHRSGVDEGLFVSDGATNLWRYSQNSSSWDAVYQPVGGVGAIGSIETSNGNWLLLLGRVSGSGYILKRELNLYSDDGASYSAFATVGSLVVAPPRKVAVISSVLIQAKVIGTYPTVSVMLNEITDISSFPATFTVLPNPVVDPPQLVGYQKTIYMKRHDFKAAAVPLPQHVQHMQVKIDFGNDTVGNELYGLGLA